MKDDFKSMMQDNFLRYASYVILDRAIPHVADGLKPVQRRILYTLHTIDDGKLHKVANAVGQTMALHPHGDAAISDALVNLANKDYLLDRQGNFGNLYTGDPAAASRYIETRLSSLARETLFNKDLTHFIPSYDSRNDEPTVLPSKIPVLLMHGAEGIAVGMSTRILPHNFCELLEAEINVIQGKSFTLLPDFPTGGIMDASDYDKGRGKVKLRAKLECPDDKTIVIKEICHGTTTESLCRSIDEAAKAGKIKIESIHDYTAGKVEIEIKLPRGQHADELIPQLYAFTDCQVSLNSSVLVINENLPMETDVEEALRIHANLLQDYLKRELEIERDRLIEKIFQRNLEQIFIENRLYKKIEEIPSLEKIHETIAKSLVPYHKELSRTPDKDDRERLLQIPIRRISRFDIDKHRMDIEALEEGLEEAEKHLKSVKRFTVSYIKNLLKTYGKHYPRRTQIEELEAVDLKAIKTRQLTVKFNPEKGFLGTKVSGDLSFDCTNFDKVLVVYKDGTYQVISVPEKQYVAHEESPAIYVGVADKATPFYAIYRNGSDTIHAKQFIVDKFILDRIYDFLPDGAQLEFLTTDPKTKLELHFKPKAKQRQKSLIVDLSEVPLKGVKARGVRLSSKPVKRVSPPGKKTQQLSFF